MKNSPAYYERNYTPLKNYFLECLALAKFSSTEYQVLLAMARQTYGFREQSRRRKDRAEFTLPELSEATGRTAGAIRKALKSLQGSQVVIKYSYSKKLNNFTYGINSDPRKWDIGPKFSSTINEKMKTLGMYKEKKDENLAIQTDRQEKVYRSVRIGHAIQTDRQNEESPYIDARDLKTKEKTKREEEPEESFESKIFGAIIRSMSSRFGQFFPSEKDKFNLKRFIDLFSDSPTELSFASQKTIKKMLEYKTKNGRIKNPWGWFFKEAPALTQHLIEEKRQKDNEHSGPPIKVITIPDTPKPPQKQN